MFAIAKKEAKSSAESEKIRQKIFDRFERTMRRLEEQERQRILAKIEAMMCIAEKQVRAQETQRSKN